MYNTTFSSRQFSTHTCRHTYFRTLTASTLQDTQSTHTPSKPLVKISIVSCTSARIAYVPQTQPTSQEIWIVSSFFIVMKRFRQQLAKLQSWKITFWGSDTRPSLQILIAQWCAAWASLPYYLFFPTRTAKLLPTQNKITCKFLMFLRATRTTATYVNDHAIIYDAAHQHIQMYFKANNPR